MNEATSEHWVNAHIGVDAISAALNSLAEHQAAAKSLLQQAKRMADVYSADLDPRLLDGSDITDALSALARRSAFSKIRILIADVNGILAQGHRWIPLAQRLSSRIEIRVIHEDFRQNPFTFLVIDEKALLYRSNASLWSGTIYFSDREQCAQKLSYFNEVWQNSRPATELRRLYI